MTAIVVSTGSITICVCSCLLHSFICVFQEDVVTDDVFILDAYDNIFLWVGEDARPEEKTMAMDGAIVSGIAPVPEQHA